MLRPLVCVWILFLVTCTASETVRLSPVDRSVQQFSTAPGTRIEKIRAGIDGSWENRVTMPDSLDDRTILVVGLHWAGGPATYREFHDCLLAPAFKGQNAILISPSTPTGSWFTPVDTARVKSIVRAARSVWQPNQVLMVGYSNGANGVWRFAEQEPEYLDYGIALAGAYEPSGPIRVPLTVFHGTADELFPIDRTRSYVSRAGDQVEFRALEKLSHYQACAYAPALRALVEQYFLNR